MEADETQNAGRATATSGATVTVTEIETETAGKRTGREIGIEIGATAIVTMIQNAPARGTAIGGETMTAIVIGGTIATASAGATRIGMAEDARTVL